MAEETHPELQSKFNEMFISNSLNAWSDVNEVLTTSFDSCADISKQTDQMKTCNTFYLPPELMEKIVCHFDGRTLLQFKLLSKTSYNIVNNVLCYNKLWKNICLKEIPKKYFIDLLNKQFSTNIPFNSLSEIQYEALYKKWLQWQNNDFKVTHVGEKHFLGLDKIKKVICHKFDVLIVFSKFSYLLSLIKNKEKEGYIIKEVKSELNRPFTLLLFNPLMQTLKKDEEPNFYIAYNQKDSNICSLHNTNQKIHDGNIRGHYVGKLVDVNINIYFDVCCWVRESWYEWHSNVESNIVTGHYCKKLSDTMYTSVVHGVILGQYHSGIVIHDIYKNVCISLGSWLDYKYSKATAAYIYTNILFIGTQNSYLLAYRLQCWDDLINLKKNNLLLETRFGIGQIIKIDIIDFKNVKAILVASISSVLWFKIT